MDIREHLETLANGDGNRIITSMQHEVDIISTFMKDFAVPVDGLKPETRIQWMQSIGNIQLSEKLAIVLDQHIKRTQELESKRAVRDVLKLQELLNSTRSPVEFGKLNRQIKALKTRNSKDLSDLTSNQHQALLKRIDLVNRWKSLLSIEIKVLEECKTYVLQLAKSAAEASGDAEFLDEVIQQIKKFNVTEKELNCFSVNMSSLQTSNILVLRKTVKHQLDEVVKLEKVIIEKRTALNSLTDIVERLKQDLPDELKPKTLEPDSIEPQSEPEANEVRPPPDVNESSSNRMAFQDKDNR